MLLCVPLHDALVTSQSIAQFHSLLRTCLPHHALDLKHSHGEQTRENSNNLRESFQPDLSAVQYLWAFADIAHVQRRTSKDLLAVE